MNLTFKKSKFTFLLLLWSFLMTHAQITKVRGYVYDRITNEAIPFAAVSFQGTNVGSITSITGEFFLETANRADTLVVSCVGYLPVKQHVNTGSFNEFTLYLVRNNIGLEVVGITPGENPAHRILREIKLHKAQHHPDNLPAYSCEVYNKVQLDLNNFGDKLKERKVMKQFNFIFDHVDTSTLSGKVYLPIMITESLSDYYYSINPKKEREVIKASKVAGFSNESVSEYTGNMYQQIKIYDNFMSVVEPGFVSPIADFGLLYYKYYLIDSLYVNGNHCYKISYVPKRKQERTFSGYFIVADSSFAIVEMQLRLSKDANINFINDYLVTINYQRINDSIYFLSKEKHVVDFNLADKTFGFFGNKTTSYSNIILQPEIPEEIENSKVNIIVKDDAIKKDSSYWNDHRHGELNKKEESIYTMVDSIKEVPLFNHAFDVLLLLTNYYYVIGPFEYGPYYTTFSNNYVEGNRIRLGGRTSNAFSTKIMISAYGAYGFKDEKFKYGGGLLYMLNKNPRRAFGLNYEYDRRQLGQTENAFMEDNIMTSLLRITPNNTLTLVEEYKAYYEHEWFQGFSNTLTFLYQTIFPMESVPFRKSDVNNTPYNEIPELKNAEINLKTRFAFEEKFLLGEFERVSLGSAYPIVEANFSMGFKNLLNSDFNYYKLKVKVSDKIEINPLGYVKYVLESGKYFGTLPYPLLELHKGNETYAYDMQAFNMMKYYEFVSDTYFSWVGEHHFNGFFLNRIPMIRKLGWREVVSARGVMGSLSEKNNQYWNFPEGLQSLSKPYMEVGIGLENIFKFFRVDVYQRLSYLDIIDTKAMGVRVGLQVIL